MLGAFLLGGLVGAVLGLLFAPRSGRETRQMISDRAEDYWGQGMEMYQTGVEKAGTMVQQGRETVATSADAMRGKVEAACDKLQESVSKGASATKSGVDKAAVGTSTTVDKAATGADKALDYVAETAKAEETGGSGPGSAS
jgi:gas vesicle protein